MKYLLIAATALLVSCNSMKVSELHKKVPVWDKQGHDLPVADLTDRTDLQTIVDKEEGQYLGHPTTHLLKDNKTILCVYPKGHGYGAVVYKKSYDGGNTWSDRLPTPKSWETSKEVPTLYPMVDPQGKERIFMFSGRGEHPRVAVTEDEGQTWSELEPIQTLKPGNVAMADVMKLKTGKGHYMATYQWIHKREGKRCIAVYTTFTKDGGLTWSSPNIVTNEPKWNLCEAGLVRSPDGSTIAMLLREDSRRYSSQIMFSKDEGKTWTEPKAMPGSLCGDRHQHLYLPDGRLMIQFRERAPLKRIDHKRSMFEGDWVAWVGTWEDLENGYEGEYRFRLKDNQNPWDCAYPAMELLPDGTIVSTTYGWWEKDHKPYILSFRFKIEEIDKLIEEYKNKR